ncbi:unnamed protein product [Clonostachys chloroleuca]|uniref:Uncharacterized protein n=3 Tax=Clonostachys chloroleuca TaxID=1926264 RepID=A0AA35Q1Y4_9HYPO|nr:unnamed protein product [Clonostachys chloroleuca]
MFEVELGFVLIEQAEAGCWESDEHGVEPPDANWIWGQRLLGMASKLGIEAGSAAESVSAHWLQMKLEDFAEAEVVPEEVVPEAEVVPGVEVVPEVELALDRKTGLDCGSESGTAVPPISEFEWETVVVSEYQDRFVSENGVVAEVEAEYGAGLTYPAKVDYELGIVSQIGDEIGPEIESLSEYYIASEGWLVHEGQVLFWAEKL